MFCTQPLRNQPSAGPRRGQPGGEGTLTIFLMRQEGNTVACTRARVDKPTAPDMEEGIEEARHSKQRKRCEPSGQCRPAPVSTHQPTRDGISLQVSSRFVEALSLEVPAPRVGSGRACQTACGGGWEPRERHWICSALPARHLIAPLPEEEILGSHSQKAWASLA